MAKDNSQIAMEDMQQTIYKELGYKSYPFPFTTPAYLEAYGALVGLNTPPAKTARVLELGATYGGNIISQAVFNPEATFVGIELSQDQVEKGNQIICDAKLENVSLVQGGDILNFDESMGTFKTWKNVSQVERADYLLKIADAIDAHKEHLAQVETYDNGKPIRETLNVDIPLGADHFRYFAGVLRSEEGSAQVFDENTLSLIVREPIGVVGQVVPWNFPFLMAAWKLAPALAAGCTVVIKPSSHTSLSLLELGDILKEILPPGVVNIVTGKGSKSGQYILDHPGFSKLAFTGSTEVGLDVYKAASERLIPATLELGGKSANIFFDDANWKQALDGAMLGILFNQGQVCCAGSRIFVQDTIYDKFVAELAALFDKVKVGLPWEKSTQLGSLIYEDQVNKVLELCRPCKRRRCSHCSRWCTCY